MNVSVMVLANWRWRLVIFWFWSFFFSNLRLWYQLFLLLNRHWIKFLHVLHLIWILICNLAVYIYNVLELIENVLVGLFIYSTLRPRGIWARHRHRFIRVIVAVLWNELRKNWRCHALITKVIVIMVCLGRCTKMLSQGLPLFKRCKRWNFRPHFDILELSLTLRETINLSRPRVDRHPDSSLIFIESWCKWWCHIALMRFNHFLSYIFISILRLHLFPGLRYYWSWVHKLERSHLNLRTLQILIRWNRW